LVRHARLGKTLGNSLDFVPALERLPGEVLGERVGWIDLFELAPDTAGLVG
jgi:hypothetical protein